MSRFKKHFCVFMLAVAVFNLALGFLNPIFCIESDGRVQLEFSKNNQCLISDQSFQKNQNEILFSNCTTDTCFDTPALGQAVSVLNRDLQVFIDASLFDSMGAENLVGSLINVTVAQKRLDTLKTPPAFVQSFLESVIILI
jgi:hypothetical protein